jgi:formylglycine-generating enzyme required for sulfatase activity
MSFRAWIIIVCIAFASCKKSNGLVKNKNESTKNSNGFKATIENTWKPHESNPKDMVWIPGGTFSMGTDISNESLCGVTGISVDANPIHRVYVDGFWMDEHEVTNGEFKEFVEATGYITVAEMIPTKEEFPEVNADNLVAGSLVFVYPTSDVSIKEYLLFWKFVAGANWRHPLGPQSTIKGKENEPVVHICYQDAEAYAQWAGKRLPTEAEWEFTARGGASGNRYVWGNYFRPNQQWMSNTFQGQFPNKNSGADGFIGVAPIKSYSANSYGLYDMSGNVWEWCSDWYRPDYYLTLAKDTISYNPSGPANSYDPIEPGLKKKVHRGGSFLCSDQYCSRYILGTRGKGEWRTGTNHLGFRCVKDPIK